MGGDAREGRLRTSNCGRKRYARSTAIYVNGAGSAATLGSHRTSTPIIWPPAQRRNRVDPTASCHHGSTPGTNSTTATALPRKRWLHFLRTKLSRVDIAYG